MYREKSSPLPPLKDEQHLIGDSLVSHLDLLQISSLEDRVRLGQTRSGDNNNKSLSTSTSTSTSTSSSSSLSSVRTLLCPPKSTAIISGGIDGRLRYWDMEKPQSSYMISGLQQNEIKPKYKGYKHEDVLVIEEYPDLYGGSNKVSEVSTTSTTKTSVLGSSGTIHHCDTILDIKCLDFTQKMLVSCSYDGVIKVWK
jgi:phosphoinositide-3-kinase regulatory subunit 4